MTSTCIVTLTILLAGNTYALQDEKVGLSISGGEAKKACVSIALDKRQQFIDGGADGVRYSWLVRPGVWTKTEMAKR